MGVFRLAGIALLMLWSMSAVGLSEAYGDEGGPPLPPMTDVEMKAASGIYFDRCAGCHGTLRVGATGPGLLPEKTRALGTEALKAFMTYGTPGGMPDWGRQGILSDDEIELLARFLQHDPPSPPEMSREEMKRSWKVYVPVDKRPKKVEHARDPMNFIGVILRDVGKVAIIDGDSKELVNIVDTGFAVHILRASGTGRYFYSTGRDGKVTLIDLWMKKPDKVAEVKTCYDARSVDVSKYTGPEEDYLDRLAISGCYWPPSFVILDGLTLEPLKVISTSGYIFDTNEFLREARVASIVASHHAPEWVVNVKETGQVWIVDYSDLANLKISIIDAERFLHDGGWDSTKRYFLVAANMRNRVVVIDTREKRLAAIVETGVKPHPGRGANLTAPGLGPVWCTTHLGDNTVACIGTDPEKHPKQAWKVVKRISLPGEGGGSLFLKTHPASRWIWVDRALNNDPRLQRSLHIIDKKTMEVVDTIEIPERFSGRALHPEYNRDGTEVWITVWGKKDTATAILVYDDHTRKLKDVIEGDWVRTPTGHFNVYNTVKDIY